MVSPVGLDPAFAGWNELLPTAHYFFLTLSVNYYSYLKRLQMPQKPRTRNYLSVARYVTQQVFVALS
jgi:hypothetical protein